MGVTVRFVAAGPDLVDLGKKWTTGLGLYVGGTKAGPAVLDGCILKVERRTDTKPASTVVPSRPEVKHPGGGNL
jgi:hypothetical protein